MNFAKDISKTKTKSISWTGGGEPTMNPNLKDAIEYIKKIRKLKWGCLRTAQCWKDLIYLKQL